MWARVNAVIMGESAGEVVVTFTSAMCQMIIQAGVCADEESARVHLAAMILSPDTGPPGSLVPRLHAEIAKLDDGKWIT
jgi:hypothetical protein